MKSIVELAFEKHDTWINIVKSFGCNSSLAEDVVQELYIQLHLDSQRLDLWYKDDVNTFWCYKVLRGIFLNTHKKNTRVLKTYIEEIKSEIKQVDDLGIDEQEYKNKKDKIDKILSDLYWYDSKVFTIVASGKSIASLSRETKISYYSLYNTYKTTLKKIKNSL
tara:strand:+ start:9 stop:500 length:492 start_codon:yes stop_codon:yes gene_type:complete